MTSPLRTPALALLAATALLACRAGLAARSPSDPPTVTATDALEVTVAPGWPQPGCQVRPSSTYVADLAHARLRFHRDCSPADSVAQDVPVSDADARAIASLASAMLGTPGAHEAAAGCGSVTDGDDITVTIVHGDGRRDLYGCGAPHSATPIRQLDLNVLLQRLDALRKRQPATGTLPSGT